MVDSLEEQYARVEAARQASQQGWSFMAFIALAGVVLAIFLATSGSMKQQSIQAERIQGLTEIYESGQVYIADLESMVELQEVQIEQYEAIVRLQATKIRAYEESEGK